MDVHPTSHPTDEALKSFGLGKLEDASSEAVDHHLEKCSACRKRVAEMSADSFLGRVRGAQWPAGNSTFGQSPPGHTPNDAGANATSPPAANILPPDAAGEPDYEIDRCGIGMMSSSVLPRIAATIGHVPHVLLRDSEIESGPGPILKPSSTEMPQLSERRDRYQFFGEIARGGMGAVLKGRDNDLGRDLAVKVLLESHRHRPELIRRFVEEAQIGGQLQHPGIVPIYELGAFADRRPYFAMKLVKGRTLSTLLDERCDRAHDLPRFLSTFESVCQTIAYAHARGVIHRDLKPSNVMVGSFGEVQVMDWGLAKVLPRGGAADDASAGKARAKDTVIATARSGGDADFDLSKAGSVMGTPSYMAPEQARGEVDRLSERCDVFALGSILCEVLTGEPAFTGRSSGEIQRKASRGELKEATDRLDASGVDLELIALAKDCLAVELEDRPRHAGDVAARINAYQTSVQDRLRRAEIARAEEKARAEEATKRARVERDRLRLTVALAGSVLALVILGGSGVAWLFQQRQARLAGVVASLVRIQAIRDQAAADGADSARWGMVLAAADQALASLGTMVTSKPGRSLAALRKTIAEDREQAELDQKLIDDLKNVRTSVGNSCDVCPSDLDARYATAFKRYKLDLQATPHDEVIRRLKSRPDAFVRQLVVSLDHWLIVRYDAREESGGGPEGLQQLLELVKRLEPDAERNRLRALLEQSDLKAHRASLSVIAEQAKVIEFGPSTALLLSQLLIKADDNKHAIGVLRAAVVRYPDDAWINFELARMLEDGNQPDDAIRYYTVVRALRPETGWDLAIFLMTQGRHDEEQSLLRELTRRNPNTIRFPLKLSESLRKAGKIDEAQAVAVQMVARLRDRTKNQPTNAVAYKDLGRTLKGLGDQTGAILAYKDAIRIDPRSVFSHDALGELYFLRGDLHGAITAYREAVRVDPSIADSHYTLAWALGLAGDREPEIAEWRDGIRAESTPPNEAPRLVEDWEDSPFNDPIAQVLLGDLVTYTTQLEPVSKQGHIALGNALAESGDLPGAIAEYKAAIRLDQGANPRKVAAYSYLGSALRLTGDLDGAIKAYREAIRLDTQQRAERIVSEATTGLGMALAESGDLPGAIAEFHKVMPDEYRLTWAIIMAQRPDSALAALRRVRDHAPHDRVVVGAIDRAIGQYEQVLKLGVAIPKVFRLSFLANNLAEYCYHGNFFRTSATIWAAGFAADPKLAEDLAGNRYNAACSAALAASGMGFDKLPLDDPSRTRWRRQAREWLKAELAYWAKLAASGPPDSKAQIRQTLEHWKVDSDLAGIRNEEPLKRLVDDEQMAFRALWQEVDSLLKKTGP
jgi:eukaryotic-like serine/threonine-protein kinase